MLSSMTKVTEKLRANLAQERGFVGVFLIQVRILPACMNVYHVSTWLPRRSKTTMDLLEPELWVVVNRHVGARNWTQVPLESNKCS